jgi:D-serine deaminase-like pyridoxal phosphate-dependent protein
VGARLHHHVDALPGFHAALALKLVGHPRSVHDVATPALLVDAGAFAHNVATMSALRPGARLRPHVKAFKSSALAAELAQAGHRGFCAATAREVLGLARAGLGDDLLLANELLDARRLHALASCGARVTVAVDSDETIDAAAAAGIAEVLIDVDVGCLRCGAPPAEAGRLAGRARKAGLEVRGVMGYEGHLMMAPPDAKADRVAEAMALLTRAHGEVGGDVLSGGGTGTCLVNRAVTELQAGSYTLMDTDYQRAGLPFRQALFLWTTVISAQPERAVVDGGLKALGMDHGNPGCDDAAVLYCSDEHTTLVRGEDGRLPEVGGRVCLVPAHVDPTVAMHERMYVVEGEHVVDCWDIDLRNW